jgi:hypothetical protein
MKIRITKGEHWSEGLEGEEFETYGMTEDEEGNYYYVDPIGNTRRRMVDVSKCEVVSDTETPNMVESPPHYQNARFETIEIIEEITAGYSDGFVAYSVGNALKYLARAPFKHGDSGLEDCKKAAKYLEFAIKRIEAKESAKR